MSKPHSVLIVDDEPNILLSLQFLMKKSGYEVRTAKDGEEALAEISRAAPDLVLLDVMMPKIDGFSMCERIRANPEWRDMRIIMLTARGRDVEREKGLALGADDYITKPFSVRELLARVRAVLRRLDENTSQNYEDDQLSIDFADIRTVCNGRKIKLTNKEFSLLSVLAKSADRVVTRQQLLDSVWGYSYYGDARTLDVHIRRLRQKLEECGDCIETVVGVGYRFTGCAGKTESNQRFVR